MTRNHPSDGRPLRPHPPGPAPHLVFILGLVLAVMAVSVWSCVVVSGDDLAAIPLTTREAAVGETWSGIAADCPTSIDRRVVIEWLQDHSHSDPAMLRAGDRIAVCAVAA